MLAQKRERGEMVGFVMYSLKIEKLVFANRRGEKFIKGFYR